METVKMIMYTFSKSVFQMGPGYNNVLATEVEAEKVATVNGIDLFSVTLPDDTIRILEPSGGIVGYSLSGVVSDLKSASVDIIMKQLEDSKETVKSVNPVSNKEFYKIYLK